MWKKVLVLFALIFTFSSIFSSGYAVNKTIFGPQEFFRKNKAPLKQTRKFSAETGEGWIIINNGDKKGKHRVSSAVIIFNGNKLFGPKNFKHRVYILQAPVTLEKKNSISVILTGLPKSYLTIKITQQVEPPGISITANPGSIKLGESSTLTWISNNARYCTIDPDIGSVGLNGSIAISPAKDTAYTITATGASGIATASATVTVTPAAPTVSISPIPQSVEIGNSSTLSWTSTNAQSAHIDNGVGVVPANGSTTISPEHTTCYTITVTGPEGSASTRTVVKVTGNPEPQPEGSFGKQYEELTPADATVESYDTRRFSVVTGLVKNQAVSPISDVAVTIHGHPEYGTVMTDTEGRFSIPVQGGGTLTLAFQKDGMLTAQRKLYVPWNDIAIAETIIMTTEDPAATTVAFDGNPDTVLAHQSTEVTDEFGKRSCTMVFTGDNRAFLVDEGGSRINELTTITTRATEFTTPESMPAVLPPTSAYTYCVDLTVDGVQRVSFGKPVITWVDNFLGFNVGMAVPVGYYDRDRGVWVPSENGLVVRLLDTDNDNVVDALDKDGDSQPDDINANGSFSDEVEGLGDSTRYIPGSTFWRVAVTHFSPWDFNWPYGPPADAISPNPEGVPGADQQRTEVGDCKNYTSSFAEERSRVFHEDIPIPGTGMTLHYTSNRVPGYLYKITVPASGDTVPSSLKRIIVRVEVVGRTLEQTLDPLPNQKAEFIWDGLDHLGRSVGGTIKAHASVGFVYNGVYSVPTNVSRSFGQPGVAATLIQAREEITNWKRSDIVIKLGGTGIIAKGWNLSPHHHVSPMDPSTLYKGDGGIVKNNAHIIKTIAGNGIFGYNGDGIPATEARIGLVGGMTVDASGNLYFADISNNRRIRKVDASGIITTVAGNGDSYFTEDGVPAIEAALGPEDVAIDNEGNLYLPDRMWNRVRKVDTNGILTTVAGNGSQGYGGDGGPALNAALNYPYGVAVDALGNLYIADTSNNRIRKVDTSGIITTVAGGGNSYYFVDGGLATNAQLSSPYDVAVDLSGNLYIPDRGNQCVRKVDASGIITTVAGIPGSMGYSGDGGPAREARLRLPHNVAVDPMGNLYIGDLGNSCIRKVDTNGIITTVAGIGTQGYSGDGGPATEAQLHYDSFANVAIDGSANLFVTDSLNRRIRKIGVPSAFVQTVTVGDIAFAEENGLGHIMTGAGHHKTTVDLDTGASLYEFTYDQNNNLISITNRFGAQITITWDTAGVPLAITSHDGITTSLTVDANNHLTRITYPDGSYYGFEYTPGGLLAAKIEPEGNRFEHVFDNIGRLTDAKDGEEGHWQYVRSVDENGDVLTEVLTGEGDLTSYIDRTESTGAYVSTITDPTGAQTLFSQSADGLTINKSLSCGMKLILNYSVDSEYGFKYVKEMNESTPSGLKMGTFRARIYEDTNADEVRDRIIDELGVNGKVTSRVHDVLHSATVLTSPEGRTVTTHYDPYSLLTTSLTVPGLYETTYGYDYRGRLTSITTNQRETTFVYDTQGLLKSITDPQNHTRSYTYDPVGRMTALNRPDGSLVAFAYDQSGNIMAITNPSKVNHRFGYDGVNLNSIYLTPISGSYNYVYDRDRRLIQTNFPSGSQISNIYDKGRLVQIQTPEGNIDLTYLCGTKVGSVTNGTDMITYGYDGSLITSEALSGTMNQSLSYGYNNDFNLVIFTYAGGRADYAYDNDGLLTAAGDFTISRTIVNGLPGSVTGGTLNLTRTFSGYGEVEGQGYTIGGQNLISWDLTRDRNGRITNRTEVIGSTSSAYAYTYDSMGRLLTVTKDSTLVEEYQYDLNGTGTRTYEMNSLKTIPGRVFTYSDEDHLLSAGDAIYQYDLDGFLMAKANAQGTDTTTYDYSSRGELLGVTLPDGTVIDYIHDPLGRRIAKIVDSVTTEKYLWQGLTKLLATYDGNDNLIMRFEYADGRVPMAMTKYGYTYYLAYDQVGSLRMIADASGNVVKRVDYDSFGNIINDTDPSFQIPFGFAGGLHDRDTGLVRFGHRDYDPDVGRWTAKDPILFKGGDTDLYGYCLNDPINSIDPSGQLSPDWHFGITFYAALRSGYGFEGSLSIARNAVAVDFAEGSQAITWEITRQHAMAGEISPNVWQSSGEALAAINEYIQNSRGRGNLAGAIHAAQDLATPGHAAKRWEGHTRSWKTVMHLLGDAFPSRSTIKEAYRKTADVLNPCY